MNHDSCQAAIVTHAQAPQSSNVSKDHEACVCRSEDNKASCEWVGHGVHYACLTTAAGEFPHRVHYGISAKSPKLSPLKSRPRQQSE